MKPLLNISYARSQVSEKALALGSSVNRPSSEVQDTLGGIMRGQGPRRAKEENRMRSRPQTVTAAAILLALLSVLNVLLPLFPISGVERTTPSTVPCFVLRV
jgi:hypothetical protein